MYTPLKLFQYLYRLVCSWCVCCSISRELHLCGVLSVCSVCVHSGSFCVHTVVIPGGSTETNFLLL